MTQANVLVRPKEVAPAAEPTAAEQQVEALNELKKQVSESRDALTQILGDPDIRRVLDAKQRGEGIEVKVAKGGERVESEEESDPSRVRPESERDPDLEEMSNAQLSQHIAKSILSNIGDLVKAELKPMSGKLDALDSAVQRTQVQETNSEIAQVRRAFPDFDKYVDQMRELRKLNQGATIKQLYLLAKDSAGELELPAPPRPESERAGEVPDIAPTPIDPKDRQTLSFDQQLGDVLDRLEIQGLPDE